MPANYEADIVIDGNSPRKPLMTLSEQVHCVDRIKK